jgi:hypothetical protein
MVKKSERPLLPAVTRPLCLTLCLAFRHALIHTPFLGEQD